jgi:serine/threonine protein kinase
MTPEHWQRIDQLFQAAIELKPEERVSFLDQTCAGDEELRSAVEALIASDEHGLSFIEDPAFEMAANLLVESKPELFEGHQLGHYTILGLLGRGGMGEVYLAEDTELGRKIAIKLLPAEYTRNDERLRRFRQEARAASALNHPNILTIHQIGQADGRHFLATEFIDGETLRQRMRRSRLSLAEIIELAFQVGGALSAAHQAGIVHRDIKPENIMLRRDGYVKVLDFGLAKLTEQHEPATQARDAQDVNISSGLVMGTVKYMSPEQALGLPVDPRSDIFSFGVVLYEMLAGRTPFEGETSSELIATLLKREPAPLTQVPDEMQRLVSRALRKKKEERFQTIQSLLAELRALSDDKAVAINGRMVPKTAETSELSTISITPLATTSTIESIVSGIKRHRTSAVFALASLVVVTIGITFGLRRLIRLRAPSSQMRISRIPNMDKAEVVAISPDGKYVAEIARNAGQYGIWLVEAATGNSVPVIALPSNVFSSGLVFSKDGDRIFYVSDGALYQVPARGGEAVKLMADVADSITMSPDEKQVAFVRNRDQDEEMALTIVNMDGSGERVLATRKKPNFIGQPAWSPDGKLIACAFGRVASNRTEGLIGYEVATGQERQITTERWQGFERVMWLPDGSALIAAAGESGTPIQIWHISYPEGEVRRITNDLDNYTELGLTADGRSLLTIQYARRSSLWIVPKGNPNAAKPITLSDRDVYRVVSFTPDGRILYMSEIGGNRDIWIMDADGSNPKQLTASAGNNILMKASPDGRYIVFSSNRANKGAFNIWRMNIDGSNPIQLTYGSGESGPACSPDGLWVVYSKGGPEVNNAEKSLWKVPIDGGEPVQLTNAPSNGAAISPDGTLISCWYKQDAAAPLQLALIPFTGGPPIKFFDARRAVPIVWPRWTPDGQEVSYVRNREGVSNIWSQPIGGGPAKQVTQFTSEQIEGFDWSRDGTIACTRAHSAEDVLLISDFK